MKQIMRWIKTHWFSVITILIVLILCLLAIYYAIEYSGKAKDVSEKRSIFQLAITAIAASVGIGTIINSTRSASISAESMRVTKEKEQREQSPHILALSVSLEIPLTAPIYKNHPKELPPDINLLSVKNYREHKEIIEFVEDNKDNNQIDLELREYYNQFLEYEEFVRNLNENKFDYAESSDFISVLNSGKGTATNLEYEFIFENIAMFSNYKFDSSFSALSSSNVPVYSICVENTSQKNSKIIVSDLKIPEEYYSISYFNEPNVSVFPIKDKETVYLNVLPSDEEYQFPIPMIFSIMVKHFCICKHYQDSFRDSKSHNYFRHILKEYLNEKLEKPKGKIIIRYTDDEINRLKNSKKRKVELTFDLLIKETNLNIRNEVISNIFLETNFVSKRYI